MTERSIATLRDGSKLQIEVAEPPLDQSYDWGALCWWSVVRDDVMSGRLARWLATPHFIGRIAGEKAGSMCYYAAAGSCQVGAVEFVKTEPRFQRRGVAAALLAALIAQFRAAGGRALYLCTTNPVAGRLYAAHGFSSLTGDGMRYLAPDAGDFDRRWFAADPSATVRDAHWGDLARVAVLYNHPDPAWLIKDSLTATFRGTRYESHFVRLLRTLEGGNGCFVVLEAEGGRVVGAAAVRRRDTYYEQHCATVSFRIARRFFDRTVELLDAAAERAAALGITQLAMHVAATDTEQQELVALAGFEPQLRWPRRLRDGTASVDLCVMLRELAPPPGAQPPRELATFYGERQPWQDPPAREERG